MTVIRRMSERFPILWFIGYLPLFFYSASSTAQLPDGALQTPQLTLQLVANGFSSPVDIAHAGDERLFIVEQDGLIRIVDTAGNILPIPFLDINARVGSSGSEQGLLGLAFAPDYAVSGVFYVNYTGNDGDTRISRFRVSGDPDQADPASEEILLTMDQPYTNHNGGGLRFGPDGMLYIGTGDGGSFGDPGDRSQSPVHLLGKMLRIEVGSSGSYLIPVDNPYAGSPDTLSEIWHFGLRNPWRYSFDRQTGDLWIGDVGQNLWEEINFQPAGSPGGENWGWRCYEGFAPYNTSGCEPLSSYDEPAYVYSHTGGGFSVTGGYVYRGQLQDQLRGHYLFADYVSGRWWSMQQNPCTGERITHPIGVFSSLVSSFGESADGELFCVRLSTGELYRVTDDCSGRSLSLTVSDGEDSIQVQVEGDSALVYTWFLNDSLYCDPVSGESGSSLWIPNASLPALVSAELTMADGCIVRLPGIEVHETPTGVTGPEGSTTARIYPQPVSDRLFWEAIPGKGGTLQLLTMQGQVLQSLAVSPSSQLISLSFPVDNVPDGTYVLLWKDKEGVTTSYLVVVAH